MSSICFLGKKILNQLIRIWLVITYYIEISVGAIPEKVGVNRKL